MTGVGKWYSDAALGIDLPCGDGAAIIDNSLPKGLLLARSHPAFSPLFYAVDADKGLVRCTSHKFFLPRAMTVAPGEFVLIGENGREMMRRQFDDIVAPPVVLDETIEEAAGRIEQAFLKVMQRALQFYEGKRLALGLSAGMDSSFMAHHLVHTFRAPFKAYTAYVDEDASDLVGARKVAGKLGLDWTPVKVEQDPAKIVEAAFYTNTAEHLHLAMSVARMAMGRAALGEADVFLQGDGADGALGDGPWEGRSAWTIANREVISIDDAWARQRAKHMAVDMRPYYEAETQSYGALGLDWFSPFAFEPLLSVALSVSYDNCPEKPRKLPMMHLARKYFPDIPDVHKKVGFIKGAKLSRSKPLFSEDAFRRALKVAAEMRGQHAV